MLRKPLPGSLVGNAYPDDRATGDWGRYFDRAGFATPTPSSFPQAPRAIVHASCSFHLLVIQSPNSFTRSGWPVPPSPIRSSCRSIHRLSVLILIHVPFRTFDPLLPAVSPAFDEPLLFLHNDTHILNDLYRPIFFGWVVEGGG